MKRDIVFGRDDYACAHCGTNRNLTIQHRANRGMGGSKTRDGYENLLTLCWESNTRLEADSAFADLGRTLGWKLSSWQNPETMPVRYADGRSYYLTPRGTRIRKDDDD